MTDGDKNNILFLTLFTLSLNSFGISIGLMTAGFFFYAGILK
jgi:hypothetical protein|tara:strand:- start:78 stop:203 length:126 start_codon:yes stop_codon:yes gene_type:complete